MIDFDRDYQMIIDGELVGTPDTLEVTNPASKESIARVPNATKELLESAVGAARAAFPAWSRRPPVERHHMLTQIAAPMERPAYPVMALLTRDQRNPPAPAESHGL